MKRLYWTLKLFILVIIVLISLNIQKMYKCYMELQKNMDGYILARNDTTSFMEASDYLTEQVRNYVITGNLENM